MIDAKYSGLTLVFDEADDGVDSFRGFTTVTVEALQAQIMNWPCWSRQDFLRQLLAAHDEECLATLLETGVACEGDVR